MKEKKKKEEKKEEEKTEEKKTEEKKKTIKVDYLARVEGEGALYIDIKEDKVENVQLKIFEPPRFFEALLRGRKFSEAPDITARICGICPVAYQMSAVYAMEDALEVEVPETIHQLRRLLYCGEWIESHVLHIYMLHAPDFLGYQDSIAMAKDHPEAVQKGLKLKKIGNEIVSQLGGREIHPINVKVGGFYRVPNKREFKPLVEKLKWAKQAALETVQWASNLSFPDFNRDYMFVALKHPQEYPFSQGRIASNNGIDIIPKEYRNHFEEEHVAHSTALHCVHKKHGAYLVGPLARYNLNFNKFSPKVQQAAREAGLKETCNNPFQSILVRSIEVLHAFEQALDIIENYQKPKKAAIDIAPKAGVGHACTEAPRGILYHRYEIDKQGIIKDAVIVPPTSQNQKTIESDLHHFVPKYIDLSEEKLTWHCEQAVRNYDPCISCSTHFLKLHLRRG